jgi:hypothetical protein
LTTNRYVKITKNKNNQKTGEARFLIIKTVYLVIFLLAPILHSTGVG